MIFHVCTAELPFVDYSTNNSFGVLFLFIYLFVVQLNETKKKKEISAQPRRNVYV